MSKAEKHSENKHGLSSEASVKEGYKKTKLGWIPTEWIYEKIGDKVDILTGFPFSSKDYTDEGIKLLRGANIKRGNIDWGNGNTVYWGEQTESLEEYLLNPTCRY